MPKGDYRFGAFPWPSVSSESEIRDGGVGTLEDDEYDCWAIQNMAARMFLWAMGQRYPCMHADVLPCCVKTADEYFPTSGPDFAREGMPFEPDVQPCS